MYAQRHDPRSQSTADQLRCGASCRPTRTTAVTLPHRPCRKLRRYTPVGVPAQQRAPELVPQLLPQLLPHRDLAEADTRSALPWKAPAGAAPCSTIAASASAASTYVTKAKPRGALVSRSRITWMFAMGP